MKFNASHLPEQLANGLRMLSDYFDFEVSFTDGVEIFAKEDNSLVTDFDGKVLNVTYPSAPAFYRAVGNVLQAKKAVCITETPKFDMCGTMYDHSRNGVLNMEFTKKFIAHLAMLGMNTYLMYMEEVYELIDEPTFGYMRGRYSQAELREIDDFAFSLGIEVIPCIQTLAHMNQFLCACSSTVNNKYRDIDDILEVGNEEVNRLIDGMFRTLKSCFRTKRFHVGMDEAHNLGRGKYLDHNGYQPRKDILARHLRYISSLADKYGVELLMWDDMFYRGEGSELSGNRPDNVHVVYWNYYLESTGEYCTQLDRRLADDPETVFAGGAWRWGSSVPNHYKTLITTKCALDTCIEKKVRNVYTTLWGDDGSEAPAYVGMLGTVMFAEYNYLPEFDSEKFAQKLEWLTGMSYDDWMKQAQINGFDPDAPKDYRISKAIFYQDPLCGIYDKYMEELGKRFDLTAHYSNLAKDFDLLAQKGGKCADINAYYAALCRALELKWDLGVRLCNAYRADDRKMLMSIVNERVIPLIGLVEDVRRRHLKIWISENKPEGFEIIDQRLGTLIARLNTTDILVKGYVDGTVDNIDCLKTERILFEDDSLYIPHCAYTKIYSAGKAW